MNYTVEVKVMPHRELLDPQGKAVLHGLHNLNLSTIENVRIGKNIQFSVSATSQEDAEKIAIKACDELLVNKIMEQYELIVKPAES